MRAAGLVLSVLLVSCYGTETGNPPFAPSVSGEAGSPMGILPPLELDQGWLALDELAFEPAAACGVESVVVRSAPVALSLTDGAAFEADAVLEEGDYCALQLERAAWAADSPPTLSGLTMALDARAPDGTLVYIRSARVGSVRIAGDAFRLSRSEGALVLFVDESQLFDGTLLADATREPDGSVLISEESNAVLLDRIEAALPRALFLFRDRDGDGRLSADERAEGPIAP